MMLLCLLPLAAFAGHVGGTVKLPGGESVPAGAVVQIELRDLSQSDAGAMLIGKQELRDAAGKAAVPFSVAYDDKKIKGDNAYGLSCRIVQKGRLLFFNKDHIAVITRGGKTSGIELAVSPVKR